MSLFTREQFGESGDDAGVFIEDLGRALVLWRAMQADDKSVADAAKAFNTTPAVIREAIDEAMWIGWHGPYDEPTKQMIEVDGE